MSRPKKSKAVLVVSIAAVLITALAVLCFLINPLVIQPQRAAIAKANADAKAQVEERNQEAMRKYLLDISEQESQSKTPVNPDWPEVPKKGWYLSDVSKIPLTNQKAVSATRSELMYNGMLLVNPWHARPDDFDENLPASVKKAYSGDDKIQAPDNNVRLLPNAIAALHEALVAAKSAGYTHYYVEEAFRTYQYQQELFQKRKEKLASKYNSEEALLEATKKQVNEAGKSEYNTGLAFQLRLRDSNDPDVGAQKYYTTPEGRWMNENSWKYGLVFRFPLNSWPLETSTDKSFKTGVSIQLSVYRYVGKGNAAIMHYLDYTLEEYIEYLSEHPHIALYVDGDLKYEVYRQYVGDASDINLQLTAGVPYESSLDNMGYVITVFNHNEIVDEADNQETNAEA